MQGPRVQNLLLMLSLLTKPPNLTLESFELQSATTEPQQCLSWRCRPVTPSVFKHGGSPNMAVLLKSQYLYNVLYNTYNVLT